MAHALITASDTAVGRPVAHPQCKACVKRARLQYHETLKEPAGVRVRVTVSATGAVGVGGLDRNLWHLVVLVIVVIARAPRVPKGLRDKLIASMNAPE